MAVVKEMALTPEEFFRSLDVALRDLDYRVEGHRADAGTADDGVTLELQPLPPRRLGGLLSLPYARVTISFRGYDADRQAAFLARFDRAFQRGGG